MIEVHRTPRPWKPAVDAKALPEGTIVKIHTEHPFLRTFQGKNGIVVGVGMSEGTIEVSFAHWTGEFYPEELEVVESGLVS